MSRFERSGDGKSMAFGVDFGMQPGTPRSFVQVWDTSQFGRPCNEGKDGFNNILVSEWDVPWERVVQLARMHGIRVSVREVFEALD